MVLGVDISRLAGPRTGVGRYLEYLLRAWENTDLPFDRVRLFSREAVPDVRSDGRFELVELPSRHGGIAWQASRLRPAARGSDVFFSPYVIPPGYRGRSVVATLGILEGSQAHASVRARSRSFHAAHSARRADAVVVHSAQTREDVIRHYRVSPERIELIHLGVTERFRAATSADTPLALDLVSQLTGRRTPYFLFVGKLSRRRNVPVLLEALARLERSDRQLLLVGPNTGTPGLTALVSRLGLEGRAHHVEHLDPESLAVLYRGARAFVLLTEQEGFSATILEALASGCPVLTREHPALREAEIDTAVLAVSETDASVVANALSVLDDDEELRARLRTAGLRIAAGLTFARTAHETMGVLARVAGATWPSVQPSSLGRVEASERSMPGGGSGTVT